MQQMVPVSTVIYKESIRKSTINLVFAILLLTKSFFIYGIVGNFEYNLDYKPILSKWTMYIIDNLLNSQLFLSKIDILALKKMLAKKLVKYFPCIFKTLNKLDIKIHFLINAIDRIMTLAIYKAKLSPKYISRFDKECKKI